MSHVLSGSVKSSENRIRVTTHLTRTSDAAEIWSQSYDRPMGAVLSMQDEIAKAVAGQLRVTLLGINRPRHRPDPRAYALIQKDRYLQRQGTGTLAISGPLVRKAIEIDPEYADAWYILGIVYFDEVIAGRRPRKAGLALVRSAYEKSLSLDPDNAVVYALLGNLSFFYEGNAAEATRNFDHAFSIDPNNLKVLYMAAALANALGRAEDATRAIEYVVDRDPVDPHNQVTLGYFYYRAGRWKDAKARFHTALAMSPNMLFANAGLGDVLMQEAKPLEAMAAYQREGDERYRLYGLVITNHSLGRASASSAALGSLISKFGSVPDDGESYWLIAAALAQRGATDDAFVWLNKASDLTRYELSNEVELSSLHADPRWLPLLQRYGQGPDQRAALKAIKFELRVPAA